MTDWRLILISALLCGLGAGMLVRDLHDHADCYQAAEEENGSKQKQRIPIVYMVIMSVLTVGISVLFVFLYPDNALLFSIKRLALLSLLWPIAFIDLKTYRIPNAFVVLGLIYRAIILAFEMLFSAEDFPEVLLSEGIASIGLLLAAVLCALVVKNSIGFGDMKLFVVMGLLLGLEGIWSSVFLSLLVSFVQALFLLITKRKGRKDVIAFGPAIAIGTYLSVILTGM